ncbi:MAG: hypothetical protein NVSMB21_11150 [Vulcanimicrobiaceae bacterium]
MLSFRKARPSWDLGLVVVCRKCDGYEPSLRRGLKKALVDCGARRRVRVVSSSCLDVCPKRATAVVIVDARGARTTIVPEGTSEPAALAPLVCGLRDGNEPFGTGPEPSPEAAR